ncbi:unnamed protein product [Prorocentrum cordatum]|uniref:Uncharacterized protein n=1 Tax=Prorocentrum cordatum TaxID=2364126 RepID=A0ABN9PXS7_9DINO|nr:unnamed protein product [Polarella glacialis]
MAETSLRDVFVSPCTVGYNRWSRLQLAAPYAAECIMSGGKKGIIGARRRARRGGTRGRTSVASRELSLKNFWSVKVTGCRGVHWKFSAELNNAHFCVHRECRFFKCEVSTPIASTIVALEPVARCCMRAGYLPKPRQPVSEKKQYVQQCLCRSR